jgi:hypothetical protein
MITEIPNAFDQLDQFDFMNGNEIEIPTNLLSAFHDGKVKVRIEILQLNTSSESFDGFAIDYCELEICKAE